MSHIPVPQASAESCSAHLTTTEVTQLATRVAADGVQVHAHSLERLARAADRADLYPGCVEILLDPNAATAQKERAFQVLHRNWSKIVAAGTDGDNFDAAFDALVATWRAHQALRSTGDIAALWQSRAELDARRVEAFTAGRS